MNLTPCRIHRPPVRGWRPPPNTIYVGPGSEYATPWRWRTTDALARVPALDGSPWELETRISADGHHHPYKHADGRITSHTSRYMTRRECIDLYRKALTEPTARLFVWRQGMPRLTAEAVHAELAGYDLACRCALSQLCHADVLLEVANAPEADR